MISAPLRVPAPKAAAGGSFLLGASSVESNPNPKLKPSRVRCAAAAAATLYEVLGLRAGATGREIKAAYRRLARERHPDVAHAPGAAAEFARLHDAYATLSDPDSRARYDGGGAAPAAAVARRPWSGAVYGRPRRRTWETDQCW
ncbi:Chaperone protein dnaJ 11, chloroplastic [Zea mays]|uniref:Chaperone protein dnaJ 11, chloroplastic n=1 Tax=Zea mays TaxID=4577 RepID=A0A317YJ12_MAIZE|nr:Chaperone protein dnaJ 11, chloroplastic [Zea mays]